MAEQAVIDIQVLTDEDDVEELREELEEAEDQAGETAESVGDVGSEAEGSERSVKSLVRSLRRLDGTDVNVDVDTDSTGGTGRRGSRLPGELDEVQESLEFIGSLRPEILATAGAVATLTGSLAAAGGLSAAALQAANETGVLTEEIKNLKGEGKATARSFAQEFKPVLEGDVIPALSRLLTIIEGASDELATFTGSVFDLLRKLKGAPGPVGLLSTIFVPFEGEGTPGPADRIENVIREVERKLEDARDRFATMRIFDIGEKKVIEDRISTLEELRMKLIETRASVDLKEAPQKWRSLDRLIQSISDGIEEAKGNLRKFRIEQQVGGLRPGSTVEGAGTTSNSSESLTENIESAELVGSARELGRQFRRVEGNVDDAKDSNRELNNRIAQSIRLASSLGATMVEAAQGADREWNELLGSILTTVGSIIGLANPVAGAGVAATGQIVSAFQHGGEVRGPGTATSDSILARLSDGEFVVNAGSAQNASPLLQALNQSPSLASHMNAMFTGKEGSEIVRMPGAAEVTFNEGTKELLRSAMQGGMGGEALAHEIRAVQQAVANLQLTADSSGIHLASQDFQSELERTGARMYPAP